VASGLLSHVLEDNALLGEVGRLLMDVTQKQASNFAFPPLELDVNGHSVNDGKVIPQEQKQASSEHPNADHLWFHTTALQGLVRFPFGCGGDKKGDRDLVGESQDGVNCQHLDLTALVNLDVHSGALVSFRCSTLLEQAWSSATALQVVGELLAFHFVIGEMGLHQ